MDEQKRIFSNNLIHFIDIYGYTQKEVADAIGVSPQTFNTWVKGIAIPRMGKIQKLADFFRIDKSDLIDKKTFSSESYYLDPEAAELANALKERPEMKMLFDASKDISAEEMKIVIEMINLLKNR